MGILQGEESSSLSWNVEGKVRPSLVLAGGGKSTESLFPGTEAAGVKLSRGNPWSPSSTAAGAHPG